VSYAVAMICWYPFKALFSGEQDVNHQMQSLCSNESAALSFSKFLLN
jgi:hypothetical protein